MPNIASGFSLNGYGISPSNEFFYTYFEAVKARLIFNYGEFAIIKIRIIHFPPDSDKLQGVTVTKPVSNEDWTTARKRTSVKEFVIKTRNKFHNGGQRQIRNLEVRLRARSSILNELLNYE